jgi:hypothetical protein
LSKEHVIGYGVLRSDGDRFTEAQVVEVVEPGDSFWEASQAEWTAGHAQALMGHLRCARAAASIEPRYGEGSLKSWAGELGVGKSTAYEYSGAWKRLMECFGSEEALFERLENSPLTIWQIIEATKGPPELLDSVEDENTPVRQIKRIISGEDKQNFETVELCCCPKCGEVYPMSEAVVWSEPR